MLKVKARLHFIEDEKLPTDIIVDIPEEYCNRDNWDKYISDVLFSILQRKIKVEYELMDDVTFR